MKKVHSDVNYKWISWVVTSVCSYHCSYCDPKLHDGKYRWPDTIDNVLKLTKEFRKDALLTFDIMGGEPTLWPHLQDFCYKIIETSNAATHTTFSTNGSRTINYWKKFKAPVGELGISVHFEYANEDHIMELLTELTPRYRVVVYLMFPVKYFDRVQKFFQRLDDSKLEMDVLINPIFTKEGLESGYTEEMKLFFLKKISRQRPTIDNFNTNFFVDGMSYPFNEFKRKGLNKFENWNCQLGKDYLWIDQSGKITGGNCKLGLDMGNIYDYGSINIQEHVVKCSNIICSCGVDIRMNPKWID
jgi:organic radical activating enzyme